jgi:drug/metabolite transporter (DMT)-like permease
MIASGLAAVINATTPLFGAAILAAAGSEPLVLRKVAGILMGVAGVAVLKGGTLLGDGAQSVGILFCLGAAMSYGFGSLWAKRTLKGTAPLSMATGQLLLSSAIMVVLAFAFDEPQQLLAASAASWLALLGLAVLATSLAYILFFRVIARSGPANVLLVTMLIPVSAIALGVSVLGETLKAQEVGGAAIILLALLLIDGRLLKSLRFRQNPA